MYWPRLWAGVAVPDAEGVERADICDMRCCSQPRDTTRGDCDGVIEPDTPRRRGVLGEKKARRPVAGAPVAEPAHDAAPEPDAPDADAAPSSGAGTADEDAESSAACVLPGTTGEPVPCIMANAVGAV